MFRKRILNLDEATLQDHGVLPAEGGLLQLGRKGKQQLPGRERGGKGRSRHPGEHSESRGTARGGGKEESTKWNEIPFSWVVRGRQERHLIDQQVTFAYRPQRKVMARD